MKRVEPIRPAPRHAARGRASPALKTDPASKPSCRQRLLVSQQPRRIAGHDHHGPRRCRPAPTGPASPVPMQGCRCSGSITSNRLPWAPVNSPRSWLRHCFGARSRRTVCQAQPIARSAGSEKTVGRSAPSVAWSMPMAGIRYDDADVTARMQFIMGDGTLLGDPRATAS